MKTIAVALALVAMLIVTVASQAAADTVLRTPFMEAAGTSDLQRRVTNLSKKTIDVQRTVADTFGNESDLGTLTLTPGKTVRVSLGATESRCIFTTKAKVREIRAGILVFQPGAGVVAYADAVRLEVPNWNFRISENLRDEHSCGVAIAAGKLSTLWRTAVQE